MRRWPRFRDPFWLGVLAGCAAGVASAGKPPPEPTIGDLDSGRASSTSAQPAPAPARAATRSPVVDPNQAMAAYQRFLELHNADPNQRAQAMRRLGDLKLQSVELERLTSEVNTPDAQGAEAIKVYTTLLAAYPEYPRNDEVLYQLAQAYELTGQPERALATLDESARRYPHGPDAAEVQFRRGELLFSAHRYADAERAYQSVVALGAGGSHYYAQSLYKAGWSLFVQGQNEQSLVPFGALLDVMLLGPGRAAPRDVDKLTRAEREEVEDTLRACSISFSYLDGPQSLDAYVSSRGRVPYAWLLYKSLGDFYLEKQRYQDAGATYRHFVDRDAVDEHAPLLTNAAIEAYRKGGFTKLLLDGKLEYVQRYGFDQPFWHGRDHGAFPQVVADLKVNLKDVAQYYHASAQKSASAEDYAAAAHWYREYIQSFPGDADRAPMNNALADSLFESKHFRDAAVEYEHTAYDYPGYARAADAGHAALVAYQRYEESLPTEARPAAHRAAIDGNLKFAEAFPAHPESAGILVRAAQDLYAAGDQPRAAQVAETLLARPGLDADKQRIAWAVIGRAAFNRGDFAKAENGFSHALAASAANDAERGDLTERLAESVYKQGEAHRAAGDQVAAAEDFLRVGRVAPGTAIVETSRYDAAAALLSAQQWDRAIDVLQGYRHDYPKGKYAADVTRKLAVANLSAGHGAEAASEFEAIAANPTEDRAVVREALTKAADLYQHSGNLARATPLLERLVKDYPAPLADAIEARQRLSEIAAKSGNAERARYWQQEIIRADATGGASRTDRTRFLAAHASLAMADSARDAFRAVRLKAPLKQSLVAKKQALTTAVDDYKLVAAYQVADTTNAATYETAELYRTLAHDLLASDRPKLSADELEQYNSLLEEQAFPFEEQSIAIHELNVKRAHEGVYDDSVRKSFKALGELKPARYGKSELTAGAGAEADDTGGAEALAKSEASLRALVQGDATNAAAWSDLGLTLRREGKFADARTAYEQALTAKADFAPAHRNLAVLLDLYLDDPKSALPEFERYQALSGEQKPVTGWIAELRQRTGIKAPAAAPASSPAAGPPAPVPGSSDPTPAGGTTPAQGDKS